MSFPRKTNRELRTAQSMSRNEHGEVSVWLVDPKDPGRDYELVLTPGDAMRLADFLEHNN